MYINRIPSSVIMVIDRIYNPIAQNMGISLFLRNEIDTEIQFPPNFFINLIQITGNLVANAVKIAPPDGLVDVVLTLNEDENQSNLNMTVTNTGKCISPDLVSAFNRGEKVAEVMRSDGEPGFGFRLEYVMQLVSREGGRIYINSENGSDTTFSLSFPLPKQYLKRRNGIYPIAENSAVLLNGV